MRRIFAALCVGILMACTPTVSRQELPTDCLIEGDATGIIADHWLNVGSIWRLRQSALLEIGPKKIPLEGFLRLDLEQKTARLLAMNEMGLILFDLELDEQGQILRRAIPQLQQINGFDQGIAQSLRQIFFQPQPDVNDHVEQGDNRYRVWRTLPGGSVSFIFDCRGDLRRTRLNAEEGDWRVIYEQYRSYYGRRLPDQIVLNDYRYGLKLTLWMREVKQEP